MTRLVTGDEFEQRIQEATRLVFRFEALQHYEGSGEDAWMEAFHRGDRVPPPEPAQDEWEAMIRARTAAGVTFQRVHVVVEPLTPYMCFELSWAYPPNARAGERIRIADGTRAWPPGVPHRDFWLLDSQRYDAEYELDGTWKGVRAVDTGPAHAWHAAAVAESIPLRDYLQRRPDLLERVAAG